MNSGEISLDPNAASSPPDRSNRVPRLPARFDAHALQASVGEKQARDQKPRVRQAIGAGLLDLRVGENSRRITAA